MTTKSTGVYSNAIRTYLKMISLAKKIGYDFLISKDLEKFQIYLKEKDFSLNPEDTTELIKALDSVFDKFPTDVEIIKDQIRNHTKLRE